VSDYQAVFLFQTGGPWILGEVLGKEWTLERDARCVTLRIPAHPDDFAPVQGAVRIGIRTGEDEEKAFEDGRVIAGNVGLIRVAVDVDPVLSSDDPPEEELEAAQKVLDDAFPTALAVVSEFLDWVRIRAGQYWIGASHEYPEVLNGELRNLTSGKRVRNINFAPVIHLTAFREDTALSLEVADEIGQLVAAATEVPTAETLLADAREALRPSGAAQDWQVERRDIRRAILLAAIASETKIKGTLLAKVPAGKRALVEIIVGSFREIEVAIGELPHKTMKAAVGRSLHEDDPNLFAAVKNLFKDRNDIAHGREPAPLAQARLDVKAAVDVFAWLDALPDPGS
jgi:hypothetical protein